MTSNTMSKITQADIDAMPIDTKLALVEAIWDSIATSPEAVPVPQWHKDILDRRLADENAETDSWENAKKRLGKQ